MEHIMMRYKYDGIGLLQGALFIGAVLLLLDLVWK